MAVTDSRAEQVSEVREHPMVEQCIHMCNGRLGTVTAWGSVKYLAKTGNLESNDRKENEILYNNVSTLE